MKKITLKSSLISHNFRLFRVKPPPDQLEEVRKFITEKMEKYLEENDGKLINVKIMRNNEICCYFVTGQQQALDSEWEKYLQTFVLDDLQLNSNIVELTPMNQNQFMQDQDNF